MAAPDRAALRAAFQDLRRRGYFARMNWLCCQTCCWAEIPATRAHKVVFYHRQDAASLEDMGGTYVAWSGDGAEIVEVFRSHGFEVEWDGSTETRIWIGGMTQ